MREARSKSARGGGRGEEIEGERGKYGLPPDYFF